MSRWPSFGSPGDEPRPWWEPEQSASPDFATTSQPTMTLAPATTVEAPPVPQRRPEATPSVADTAWSTTDSSPIQERRPEPVEGPHAAVPERRPEPVEGPVEGPAEQRRADTSRVPTVEFGRPVHGITARGVFVAMVVPAALGCLLGFLVSGAVTIGPLAGWGLLAGSLFAGWKASPRLGWYPAFLPPLAMLAVVAVLGQVAVLGTRPTVIREVAMIVAGLTATAPAQLASVLGVAALIGWRRRSAGSGRRD